MTQTQTSKTRILVVDDSPEIRLLVTTVLQQAGYDALQAADGARALEMVRQEPPSLILLDLMMPGMDGYEVCARLKSDDTTRAIPVIFLSGLDDTAAQTRAFEAGAADFVTKPIGVPVLLARVNTHLALYAQRRSLEGKFRDVIEFAPDAIILSDQDGRIVQANARTLALFGYARDELLGHSVEMLLTPEGRAATHERRAAVLRQPRGSRVESQTLCLRKDGREFVADVSVSALHAGRGPLLLAMVRDATNRIAQQEKLREAARYARSLIETSMDPMVLIDLQGKVQDANDAACQITGLAREALIGSDAPSRFTEPEKLLAGYKQVMAEGQALNYQLGIRHTSGRTYDVLCNAKAFRNEAGEVVGLFASAHDVTESRRIQQEVSVSRQRLREMAARGEAMREYERKNIAREVHDELGQVLTALRMDLTFTEMRHGSVSPELTDKLREMRGLVDRAIQGVRNVAANLRPSALDMGLVPAIEWLCSELTRHAGIPCEFDGSALATELPEDRAIGLFRIVQESLTNVTRYAQASRVLVTLQAQGDALVLEVVDDGQGFDPEQARARRSFGLLGMEERALALGGRVDISSAPGQGARVRVEVPLHQTSPWQVPA